MLKRLKTCCGVSMALCAVIYVMYLQFTNIDMTQARLFLTFWKEIIAAVVFCLLGGVIALW